MNVDEINSLTDWIGIPLVIVLIALLITLDAPVFTTKRMRVLLVLSIVVVGAASIALNLFRFIEMA